VDRRTSEQVNRETGKQGNRETGKQGNDKQGNHLIKSRRDDIIIEQNGKITFQNPEGVRYQYENPKITNIINPGFIDYRDNWDHYCLLADLIF
jgi:hypothetical protein